MEKLLSTKLVVKVEYSRMPDETPEEWEERITDKIQYEINRAMAAIASGVTFGVWGVR